MASKPHIIQGGLCIASVFLSLGLSAQATSFYSRIDGTFEANGTWSSTSHNGSSSGSNPGCGVGGNANIYIEDSVVSVCSPMLINGTANIVIRNGGHLEIGGDLEIFGNALFDIDSNTALTINGDLEVSGSGELELNGDLIVNGDVSVSGSGSVCGNGNAQISGSISGEGWCFSVGVLPIDLISFTAQVDQSAGIELQWSTALEVDNDRFSLERSSNGMTFDEIASIPGAGNSSIGRIYSFIDNSITSGTYYYRLTQIDYNGDSETFEVIAVTVEQDDQGGICDLQISPNPCTPSCSVVLEDCPGGQYRTILMDGSGRMVSELIPVSSHPRDRRIEYHLNKENFMMPGVYFIRASSQQNDVSKKLIIQ